MMTSNLLSRLLPSNHQGRSIYEDLRAHDEDPDSDLEENAGLGIDEENLGYRDEELGNVDLFNGVDSHITTASTPFLPGAQGTSGRGKAKSHSKPRNTGLKWTAQSPRLLEEDPDDDVPASLLIEDNDMVGPSTPQNPRIKHRTSKHPPIPGPSNRETRAHWEAAQAQQRLHQENRPSSGGAQPIPINAGFISGSAREKAMWRWINVTNLDNFIREVYDYFHGAGVWCILTEKVTNLV
jgi:autophagy-related protein 9